MRLLRLASIAALAVLLAGCGNSSAPPTVTVTAPTGSTASTTETAIDSEPAETSGPYGELGTSSVGPVEIGMNEKQVEAIFGKPDEEQEVSFAGPGVEAPQLDWVWDTPDGEVRLQFQTSDGTVTGYRSFSTELATASGYTVGTPAAEIEAKWGDKLGESPIGTGTLMLSEGDKGTWPAIVFAIDDKSGDVMAIEGGLLQPAGD